MLQKKYPLIYNCNVKIKCYKQQVLCVNYFQNQGPFILEGDEYVFYENGSRKTFQMFKEDIDFSDK